MLSGFADAAAAAGFAVDRAVGSIVVCRRGGEASELSATPGSTTFQTVDEAGAVTQFVSRDFLCDAAAYRFGDKVTLPRRGDTIEETDATGKATVFEVMNPDATSPPYRLDISRSRLRIHTKQVRGR